MSRWLLWQKMTALTKEQYIKERRKFFNEAKKRLAIIKKWYLVGETKMYWKEDAECIDMIIHTISDNLKMWQWIEIKEKQQKE